VTEPAVPQYLRWSKHTISWSRADHPPRVDNPGQLVKGNAAENKNFRPTHQPRTTMETAYKV
jgi:hypothetical protein